MSKAYIGIDVGSEELVISQSISTTTGKFVKLSTKKIKNQTSEINAWIGTLSPDVHLVFEVTGNYSLPLAYCLELSSIAFTMISPLQSKGYAQTLKITNQNDQVDASLLAYYGVQHQPACTPLESEQVHQLKQKRKHLSALMSQKQAIDNQLHALDFDARADKMVIDSLSILQATFNVQIEAFKSEIFTLTEAQYEHIYKLMTTITGIGDASATAIIVATNGLENFNSPKQLAKFSGLTPNSKESGKSVRYNKGLAKAGAAYIRSVLYMAARSARRYNTACKNIYERIRAKGKPHKVAMVAVMHKLIRQVFAVVKKNTPFVNNFEAAK